MSACTKILVTESSVMEVTKVVTGVKRSRNVLKTESGKCKKAAGPREAAPLLTGSILDGSHKQAPRPRRSRGRRNPRTKHLDEPKNDEIKEQVAENDSDLDRPKEPRLQYTRDELMALKAHPLCILRPDCFDPSKNKRVANLSCIKDFGQATTGQGRGSGSAWERGKQDSPSPADDPNAIVLGPEKVKRVADPRERIRKEQDGIVLSPQRRSFNSGCFVPGGGLAAGCGMGANAVAPNAPRRPESPLGKGDSRDTQIREIPTRRIGSGRIMNREREAEGNAGSGGRGWEFNDRSGGRMSSEKDDFSSFRGLRERDRDDRFERRSFGREYERNEKDRRGAQGSRYGNDRRRDKDDEPEWFSGGPTSQHDTIELHGFEEGDGKKKKKQGTPPKAKSPVSKEEEGEKAVEGVVEDKKAESETVKGKENIEPKAEVGKDSFNIEEFLKHDIHADLSQVFAPGYQNEASEPAGGSRFSRFFKPESPTDNRRSSIQDEFLGSFIKEIDEPKVNIPAPGGSEAYFAPISPAAAGSSGPAAEGDKSSNLLAMLQRGQQQEKHSKIKELERSGRLHSVEELEAKMLQHNLNASRHSDKDQEAFQKLFMQTSQEAGSGPDDLSDVGKDRKDGQSGKPNPASRLSGRIISQGNKDIDPAMFGAYSEQKGHPQQQIHPPQQQQQQMPAVPQDVLLKLLELQQQQHQQQQLHRQQQQQQQQQQESKFYGGRGIFGGGATTSSPVPPDVQAFMHNVHPNHDMMMRPEAQNILEGLRHGKLTVQHLVHQLHNQSMNPRIKEMVAGVIKVHLQHQQQQQQQQARAVSPLVPMHQQMRITSPMNGGESLMHQGIPHRVPSPHELILHTRQIMQNALLKKKLEEQTENFHRKQEKQRAMSPANSKPSSSSPLAFTPTSVLRKMTAEKDFEAADPKSANRPHMAMEQHSNWKTIEPVVPKPQQGRPIVKGGSNQQQPPFGFQQDMTRVPQPSMLGMQRMMGAQKLGPQGAMQQQAFMNQQNMFQQQNRDLPMDNSGSNLLLQQLLSGQRSINSINMAQQQPHGMPRPLRGQQADSSSSTNLSQWFSGAGQMGAMPPIPTANTFSVEELERRQQPTTATPVHN